MSGAEIIEQLRAMIRAEEKEKLFKDLESAFMHYLAGEDNTWRIKRNFESLKTSFKELFECV